MTDKEIKFLEFEPIEYEKVLVPFGFFDYSDILKNFLLNISAESVRNATIVEVGSWVGKSTLYMAELIEYFLKNKVSPSTESIRFVNVDPFIADANMTALGVYEWVESTDGLKPRAKEAFYKNTKTHRKYIETIEDYSLSAAEQFSNSSVDCVWIDAKHDYESIYSDMSAWFPKVKEGGIMGGHDFTYDFGGVPRAVHDFCIKNHLTYIVKHKSFTIVK
jgi:hypothetical protein